MYHSRPIDGELLNIKNEILQYARDYGLDFHPVVFELCDYDTINILAAQGGFPTRYPNWRFGMEYDQLSKGYTYGVQKIYEMVINTNPCYAYLLNVNPMVDQKIVMAHVYGHADFFKNNLWFRGTNLKMMDVMANHGTKIRRYMEQHGQETVENFIDKVLSLENLLDIDVLFKSRKKYGHTSSDIEEKEFDGASQALQSFMRSKFSDSKKRPSPVKSDDAVSEKRLKQDISPRDIMLYLLENAPLEEWQSDVIGILREEAYYFLPQRLTKIINEGWASYWHSTIMTKNVLHPSEVVDFADRHSSITAMSNQQINPYKVGIELFRDIKHRWDSGKFGKDYLDCTDMEEKARWDTKEGEGSSKIFEVRRTHNDITFIDEFFTEEFCMRQQLFTYKFNHRTGRFEIDSKDFLAIKQKLLATLTNYGQPVIEVTSGNFANRGELHLQHTHQGLDLDMSYAAETCKNINYIWKRPVNLTTVQDGKEVTFCHDGNEFKCDSSL